MSGSGPQHAAVRTGRRRLADVGISAKVAIAVLLPLLTVVGLGAAVGVSSWSAAVRVGQARDLVALAAEGSSVVRAVQQERAAAVLLLQSPARGEPATTTFAAAVAATDQALVAYRQRRAAVTASGVIGAAVIRVDGHLAGLEALRRRVVAVPGPSVSGAAFSYRIVVAGLLDLRQAVAVSEVSPVVANQIRAAAALSQAAESLALEQVSVLRAASFATLSPAVQRDLLAARAGYVETLGLFTALGDPAWAGWYAATVAGPSVVAAESVTGQVAGTAPGAPVRVDVGPWLAAVQARTDLIAAVQGRVDGVVLAATEELRQASRVRSMGVVAVVVVVVLLAALVTIAVGRHLSRRLRTLRRGSHQVSKLLPEAVAALEDPQRRDLAGVVERFRARATELVVADGNDEIGAMAAAFRGVVGEAVRLAGEQTRLQADNTARTVAVARRVQQQGERLTKIVDLVERDEVDPDRLQRWFEVDHEVTMTHRYADGLLVLSGVSPARVNAQPVPLSQVLQAGQSRIRAYQQIVVAGQVPQVAVKAEAVHHLAHLLAELMDNATAYSPPGATVTVEAWGMGDRVVVQIRDHGVGIEPADLAAYNALLARPQLPTSRDRIGLAVVATLAAWIGAQVVLRPMPDGLIAEVTVYAEQLTAAHPQPALAEAPTWPAPQVTGPTAVPPQRQREHPIAPSRGRSVDGLDQRRRPGAALHQGLAVEPAVRQQLEHGHLDANVVAATLSGSAAALADLRAAYTGPVPTGSGRTRPAGTGAGTDTTHLPLTNGVLR
ncbi:nitrate- and nitrite sensing domain-containing protein [Dactylosporangium sp. NBC_01737]|uniref:sensor histidine kinase n=1 Tax=Dactylosporangium sp. NBC_01737 TaxID=2975959 RepID=UPI002E1102B2|nr:nitrate- and nitrite sensing domain-containing protein [Dactylosporangium sp. NBC_01737]